MNHYTSESNGCVEMSSEILDKIVFDIELWLFLPLCLMNEK